MLQMACRSICDRTLKCVQAGVEPQLLMAAPTFKGRSPSIGSRFVHGITWTVQLLSGFLVALNPILSILSIEHRYPRHAISPSTTIW